MNEYQELIEKRLRELPDYVRDAIGMTKPTEAIARIAAKNKLHVDQTNDLATEVYLVMLGLIDPNEFEANLKSEVKLSQNLVGDVMKDVSEQLFLPIRDAMRRFMGETADNEKQKTETENPAEQQKKPEPVSPNRSGIETPFSKPTARPMTTPFAPATPPSGIRQVQMDRSLQAKPQIAEALPQAPTKSVIPPSPPPPSPSLSPAHIPPSGISAGKPPQSLQQLPQKPRAPERPFDDVFAGPSVKKEEVIDVGLSAPSSKRDYKGADPYRELTE